MLVGGWLYLHFAAAVGNLLAHVGCLVGMKMHMGFLLRQYRCPIAMRVVSEKGSHVVRPQREKVPTCRFSAKKETMWHNLLSAKRQVEELHYNVFITVTIDFIISKYMLIQILVHTVNKL